VRRELLRVVERDEQIPGLLSWVADFVQRGLAGGPVQVSIGRPRRNLDQSAMFHAICGDFAKSGVEWFGKQRTLEEWKVLLISGHAIETGKGAEVVPGIEGELVSIRESTARMSKARASSLIEYCKATAAEMGVKLKEPE